jgi:16S rRNA (uracil1498-N3)-methyltransferase
MRWDIPVVTVPTSFEAWCTGTDCHTPRLIFWEDPRATPLRERLRGRPQPTSVALAIGPEGGFEADEIELATKNGFEAVSLGPRILRTESAVLAVLTILQYEWGDLG